MKLGVSSYSYSGLVSKGLMAQIDVAAKTREIGFDVIEFSTISLPAGANLIDYAKQLREACDRVNLPVANYTIGADFINGSNGDWKAEVARLKTELEVAKILGAPGMRHDATRGFTASHKGPRSFDDALPTLIKGCRAVTEMAADMGIRTMVENHGFFCQDSERIEKLMNGVNHENFGLLLDIGNFMCADENPAFAVGRVMPYAIHVHAKDFHLKQGSSFYPGKGWFRSRAGNFLRGAIIGHGDAPILQCLGIMKRAGYKGVLSIEFEGMEEPLNAIALGFENLKRLVAAAE